MLQSLSPFAKGKDGKGMTSYMLSESVQVDKSLLNFVDDVASGVHFEFCWSIYTPFWLALAGRGFYAWTFGFCFLLTPLFPFRSGFFPQSNLSDRPNIPGIKGTNVLNI